jgi:hypothetical protein
MLKSSNLKYLLLIAIIFLLYSCSPATTTTLLPTSHTGGTVGGILLTDSPSNTPVGMPVYLGEVLLANGTPALASLDKQTAPKTLIGQDGRFVFVNVPPGTYSLIIDMVINTVILRDPTTGGDILVDVKEGETVDLGTLNFPNLSLTPQP